VRLEATVRVFIPAEQRPGEQRVACLPEVAAKIAKLGYQVVIESGAGQPAYASDADYTEVGAEIAPAGSAAEAAAAADVVASVRPLDPALAGALQESAIALSFLSPGTDTDTISAIAGAGATALSFDLVPRISRAQSMDALTSQALVAGYRAAEVGAARLPRFFPLFMTAAGTIPPAKVLVLGAGVAGLQAIATAKRLGAVVSAYDVRPASADEVKSMGGKFITLELDTVEGSGGYAREMTADRAQRQQQLLTPYVAESDVVITTAAVPGRRAPLLVTEEMVATMRPGSVVVDLAAETGGNVAGSRPGEEIVTDGRVTIWGGQDVPSSMPVHASQLYAMNVLALLGLITADGAVALDPTDEIIEGCAVVLRGTVRHPAAIEALGLAPPPAEPTEELPASGEEGN
jgi:NAD(P) transhydrogenase subunit alpha